MYMHNFQTAFFMFPMVLRIWFTINTFTQPLYLIKSIVFVSMQDVSRSSVCHSATVISNSYMHCGTTSDTFLRYASCCFFEKYLLGYIYSVHVVKNINEGRVLSFTSFMCSWIAVGKFSLLCQISIIIVPTQSIKSWSVMK